jgi:hypothetical protein
MTRTLRSILLTTVIAATALGWAAESDSVEPRSEFDIPLAHLSPQFDELEGSLVRVRIIYGGDRDAWTIGMLDDTYIRYSKTGRETNLHAEAPSGAHLITNFEAEQLDRVCKTFIKTLAILEGNLQRERWDRCRYLDGYLPHFLKNFYYLYCAARNSPSALPKIANIPESAFDVSQNSPISDKRIGFWRDYPEHTLKLRITIKELIYQTRQWQKSELANPTRDKEVAQGSKFEEALSLFIRLYFNRLPSPIVPEQGKHL